MLFDMRQITPDAPGYKVFSKTSPFDWPVYVELGWDHWELDGLE